MNNQHLFRDDRGATIVETAFALPAFIVLLWGMVQLGLVYRANSGIQHSLGEGARFATLYPTPTDTAITAKMNSAVYGIGPGRFATTVTDVSASGYKDLLVTYTQATNLLLFPGPTINVSKSKRVWVASTGAGTSGSGSGTGTGSGSGGGSSGGGDPPPSDPPPSDPPPSDPPPTTPPPTTPPPTTPPPTTGNGSGNNGNGNGNTVCKKANGKAC